MKKKKNRDVFYFSISFSNLLNDKKTTGTKLMADGAENLTDIGVRFTRAAQVG